MKLPSPPMMLLRSVATLEISAVIAQVGWAAAFLGGEERYEAFHSAGALVTIAICGLGAIVYVVMRRHAGPVNVTLAVALAAALGVQYALGESHAIGPHIFFGVLIAMLVTALTSWTYRHDPQEVS